MKKRIVLLSIAVILILAFMNTSQYHYRVYDSVSDFEEKPLDRVSFAVEADKRECTLHILNGSEYNIVSDFSDCIFFEVKKDDGWHRVIRENTVLTETAAFSKNKETIFEFAWKDLIGSHLPKGNYRLTLEYGDQHVSEWDFYRDAVEFNIE